MSTGSVDLGAVPSSGGGSSGVSSLNSLTGALAILPGTNITVTPSGSGITIGSTAGGSGITSINSDTTAAQTLVVATTGTDFTITTSGGISTFAIPSSSASNRGLLLATDWTTFNGKQAAGNYITALTGDGTASGPGSAAFTLATVNSNVGSFTAANITVDAKGRITAAANGSGGGGISALTGDVTASGSGSVASTVAKIQGTTVSGTTGTTNVVFSSAPTLSNPVVGTQSQGSANTLAASTAYVDTAVANAVSGVNPAVAVQAGTTSAANTSGFTYNNGASGVGASLTGPINTALIVDGFTLTAVGQRLLVKDDTQSPSGAFNGIYFVSALQTVGTGLILVRALDYDTTSDMNNTGAIPIINGTVNGTTSWVLTSQIVTVGTTPLTFTRFTRNPADYLLKANNLSDVSSASTSFNNISPLTTKGDLVGFSTVNARLPVGTDTFILTADSTQTLGVKWAAATSGGISALTGDVTASGSGSVAATIAVGAVTDTKASLAVKPAVTVVATTSQTLSGVPTIDGVALAAATSMVLLTAQGTASQNGPWIVQTGAWTRPTWFPSGGTTQCFQFITTLVRLGTVNAGTTWRQTTAAPITIDTDSQAWAITPLTLGSTTVLGTLPATNLTSNVKKRSFFATYNGFGVALTVGNVVYTTIPYSGTISKWTILGDQSGSIVIDIWKTAFGASLPTVTNTITASAKPTISSAVTANSTTLTGWTTTVTAGDIVAFHIDSITTLTYANIVVEVDAS